MFLVFATECLANIASRPNLSFFSSLSWLKNLFGALWEETLVEQQTSPSLVEAGGGDKGQKAESVLLNPQVRHKGEVWHDARNLRCALHLSASLPSVDVPGGRCSGGTAAVVVIIPVIAVERCWVPEAVLSTLHSLSHLILITTSEVDDVDITIL